MMKIHVSQRAPTASLNGEQRHAAMRYFCTHSPPRLIMLFTLSFLSLALSLNTTQVEVMKNICNLTSSYYYNCNHTSDPCQWDGVSCSEKGGDIVGLDLPNIDNSSIWQYVCKLPALQHLDLSNNSNLDGPIPECVGSFANLTILRLSFCSFSESIPPQLCSLRNLQVLDLSNNQLTGFIPPQLFSLSNLRVLYLQKNNLTGIIPPNMQNGNSLKGNELTRIGKLYILDLSHNSLTGEIPITLSNLGFTEYNSALDLSHNRLKGEIPEALGKMRLYRLNLTNNKLTGKIPESLENLSSLHQLDLSSNNLTGKIPESLGNLSQIKRLDLSNNKLTGKIPESLGNASYLYWLDLSNNKLTGKIPLSLRQLSSLYQLDLSKNNLTGKILDSVAYMSLHLLNLSNNKLTGKIPESLGYLSSLYQLDLSNNFLTGKIPQHLGNMGNVSHLYWLNLSNNKLTGKIPESLKQIPHLDLSNNELVGSIPPRKNHSKFLIKVMGAVGTIAVFVICCLVSRVLWIRSLHNRAEFKQTISKILQKVEHPRISYEELLAATNRFHNSNLLSTNSFGSVYKGFLPDGTRVAVKVLNLMHEQSHKIFKAECKVLQKARHRNLARIITTCSTICIKALIFEYFSNGSLEKHLYLDNCRLGLRKLLNIAMDIAHAVEYLHYDCFVQIVHCDIKPSNVLLDESMTAHLSDFGISRLRGRITANSVSSTIDLKGSVGYIAPEYGLNGMTSPRGDVYSYGILLLEMLTRKRPTDNMFDGDLNLHKWVKRALPDRAFEVVDKSLLMEGAGKETEECLIFLLRLGLLCSSDSPEARPTMRNVSNLLKNIQQDFTADTSSIKLKPTISNLVCDRGAVTICEEESDTQSSSF